MKKILMLISSYLLLVSFTVKLSADDIVSALKNGNIESVISSLDSYIDLKLPEKEEVKNMSKNQAGVALKSFFVENGIKGFTLASQREMSGTMYVTGKLQNNGKGYNITLMMKVQGNKTQIITVRIN